MTTAVDAAAKLLGMSSSDIASALQKGQSLSDIAKSKGVSQDELVKAIATALQSADSNLSSDQATQIANNLSTRMPPTPENNPWAIGTTTTSSTVSVTA